MVEAAGGQAVLSKSGHAFIKQRMREVDAVYGGEMSAHHYFRRFAYCDSGMIPWLLVAQIAVRDRQAAVRAGRRANRRFPVSGELNYRVPDAAAAMAAIESRYAPQALEVDRTDGVSFEFARLALQSAHVEHRAADPPERRGARLRGAHAQRKTRELLELLKSHGAVAADH